MIVGLYRPRQDVVKAWQTPGGSFVVELGGGRYEVLSALEFEARYESVLPRSIR
jgi:hypothetical protein